MTNIPSFLVLRSCAENNSKIIVNINEIQSINEIERDGNSYTKIHFINKNESCCFVQETVEEISNLLGKEFSVINKNN